MSNRPEDFAAHDPFGLPMADNGAPPPGFPSDQELTRLANEMFASCSPSGTSPFETGGGSFAPDAFGGSPLQAPTIAPESFGQQDYSALPSSYPMSPVHPPIAAVNQKIDLPYSDNFNLPGTGYMPPEIRSGQPNLPRGFGPVLLAEPAGPASAVGFDPVKVRKDFPILSEVVNGRPLVWLDNAATTQKPQAVIDRLSHFYLHENSNIHRAAHELARRATDAYEAAREAVARFINASSEEIIFVRGTTEAINLISQTFGRQMVGEGDEIIVTHLEHHANIVPWQQLCFEKKARLLVAPVDDHGQIQLDAFQRLFSPKTRLVSMSHVSNALGTITPAKEMIDIAHRFGVPVVLDGAQSISHMPVDVRSLGADFFVFSGHKVFAPTGIGAVYGKRSLLEQLPPWQGGGNMIKDVTFERTLYHPAPMKFEAGTGNIADAVGLHAAIDYVQSIGIESIAKYEHALLEYGTRKLAEVPGLRMIGTAENKAAVLSFVIKDRDTESIGRALSQAGIAVRAGHHCAQPILRRFGVESTVRASLAFYNLTSEIDRLVEVLQESTYSSRR